MFARFALFLLAAVCVSAQESDRIWAGVYTAAQAGRGKAVYEKSCTNCHGLNLDGTDRAPALRGDRFMSGWWNTSVSSLFRKLRDSMPATYPETVSDEAKLDIVAFLLQTNAFPAGAVELKLEVDELDQIQIAKKGSKEVPNFALVQVTGCVSPGPANTWLLTNATEPVVTREETPSTAPAAKPLGTQTFLLISAAGFQAASHQGHKVEARGLLYQDSSGSRLNLTYLGTVAPSCGN
jgi:mono/diheme cytochrome c family protein